MGSGPCAASWHGGCRGEACCRGAWVSAQGGLPRRASLPGMLAHLKEQLSGLPLWHEGQRASSARTWVLLWPHSPRVPWKREHPSGCELRLHEAHCPTLPSPSATASTGHSPASSSMRLCG